MREKFPHFVSDVTRFGPLVAVALATLLCVPSLEELFDSRLSLSSMLGRYLVALVITTIGVRAVSHLLIHYAHRNIIEGELDNVEAQMRAQNDRV